MRVFLNKLQLFFFFVNVSILQWILLNKMLKCYLLSLSLHNRTLQCLQLFGSSFSQKIWHEDTRQRISLTVTPSLQSSERHQKSISKLYKSHLHLIENRAELLKINTILHWNYTVGKNKRGTKANRRTNTSCDSGAAGLSSDVACQSQSSWWAILLWCR